MTETLDSLSASLSVWRSGCKHTGRYPKQLKTRIQALLQELPTKKISEQLGISRQLLNRWQNELSVDTDNKTPLSSSPEFIRIIPEPSEQQDVAPSKPMDTTVKLHQSQDSVALCCQITLPGEIKISLEALPLTQLGPLINQLRQEG